MRISHKLLVSLIVMASLIAVVGYFGIETADQVRGLRDTELPMEQNVCEVEVSLWEAIHAADAYLVTAQPEYKALYKRQVADVDGFFAKYEKLLDTPQELPGRFLDAWRAPMLGP